MINETHAPSLRSWVDSANAAECDFPIHNLPFAVFRRHGTNEAFRVGVAIGDQVLDLSAPGVTATLGLESIVATAVTQPGLNDLMALGQKCWSALRLALSRALRERSSAQAVLQVALVAQSTVEYTLPARIGDYTDFYTSVYHATNVGKLFRPDNPLMPNYKWVPIGYHGRSSSIGISGQAFPRPKGQLMAPGATAPILAPSQRLDIELELGIFIGEGNASGDPIPMAQAEDHVFGLCLLNDWSARDIQAWEYQPLGPFLAKNFASTISPWVVTLEALAPYRTAPFRPAEDPQPLPYLDTPANRENGALDIQLEVLIQTAKMKSDGVAPHRLVQTSYRHAYWTVAQLVTHHTVNGCNLQPGDLFGSGTLSGPTLDQAGALLELTAGGKNPITLPNGETRTFLADGDTIVLHGHCVKPDAARIGFGECVGTLLQARS